MKKVFYKDIKEELEKLQKGVEEEVKNKPWNSINTSWLYYDFIRSNECLTENNPEEVVEELQDFLKEIEELPEKYFGQFSNEIEATLSYGDYASIDDPYFIYRYYRPYTQEELKKVIEKRIESTYKRKLCDYFKVGKYKWDCKLYDLFVLSLIHI